MARFTSPMGFSRDMVALFGGTRFHYMDLFDVNEPRLLLSACAETLETLLLDPTDPQGEQLHLKGMRFPTNNFTAESFLLDFDLSRNKSLRTFEIEAQSIISGWKSRAPNSVISSLLRTVLSPTIASPAFSEAVVFYLDQYFTKFYSPCTQIYRRTVSTENAEEASWHRALFEVFREMHTVGAVKRAIAMEKD